MIKFISEDLKEMFLTLGDVEEDQFFVDTEGYLCQKTSTGSYNVIAMASGTPVADTYTGRDEDTKVLRVLPRIKRIEF